jgi:hypothetical protein
MRFSKIKYNGEKVELEWTIREEDGTETGCHLVSREKPMPPFRTAMEAFVPLVAKLLGWTANYAKEGMYVTGLSINTEDAKKGGARGLIVSGRKDLEGARAPFFFNTPHLREAPPESEKGTPGLYGQEWAVALEEVEKQATLYQKGEREQTEMFSGDEETDEVPAGVGAGEDED